MDIELDKKKLIVNFEKRREHSHEKTTKSRLLVNILAEEIGYNARSKEYRTILIDKPLLLDQKTLRFRTFRSSPRPSSVLGQRLGPKRALKNQEDCSHYLESISQEITVKLEGDIRLLQSNYIILSKFLDDASERIKNVCETYIPKYESKLGQIMHETSGQLQSKQAREQRMSAFSSVISQAIRLSVENYVMYLLHGKIIASIHSLYEQHDLKVMKNFDSIQRAAPDITSLGAQAIFSDFHISDQLSTEIRQLSDKQSPLAIISSLTKSIELINESLNQNVKFKHLLGFGSTNNNDDSNSDKPLTMSCDNELVTICSDDLIASLVYCFANVKPTKLYSISHYLNIFGWSSSARDHAAYYAATFHLVVQYIYTYDKQNRQLQEKQNQLKSRSQSQSQSQSQLLRRVDSRLNQSANSNQILRPIISAKPKRVESVKSLDSFSHKRSPSRSSLATHFSLLDANSIDLQQQPTRDEQISPECISLSSSASNFSTKSGWTFL